jgi:hypothetical protein
MERFRPDHGFILSRLWDLPERSVYDLIPVTLTCQDPDDRHEPLSA